MFGSAVLDVIIGLVTLYFLLSVICSALAEAVALWLNLRSAVLLKAIEGMLFQRLGQELSPGAVPPPTGLGGFKAGVLALWSRLVERSAPVPDGAARAHTGFTLKDFYNHGFIWNLGHTTKAFTGAGATDEARADGQPAYIPPEAFSRTLVDLVATHSRTLRGADGAGAMDVKATTAMPASVAELIQNFKDGVSTMDDAVPLKRALGLMLLETGDNYEALRKRIETWYDQTMDRARGWYKGRATIVIAFWATIVCAAANVDTIAAVRVLSTDPKVREQAAAVSYGLVQPIDGNAATGAALLESRVPEERMQQAMKAASQAGFPIGWNGLAESPDQVAWKIIGIALSVAAVSLGAPFWFDLLNRLVNVRLAGQPVETQSDKAAARRDHPDRRGRADERGPGGQARAGRGHGRRGAAAG
jgi:hypothetical protein